jgi:hypothetical protein
MNMMPLYWQNLFAVTREAQKSSCADRVFKRSGLSCSPGPYASAGRTVIEDEQAML